MTREVPPVVHETLRASGQPLDAHTRAFMESRFGQDFSHVRVHTDARAAESAEAVDALAYTFGQDVVFGAGQYRPDSFAGKRLLAHELTHVAQQQSGAVGFRQAIQRETRRGTRGGRDPIHDPLIEDFRREEGLPPGGIDQATGERIGPTSGEIRFRLLPQWLAARPPARFIEPRPQPQDPLARLAAGGTPGLTTAMVNGRLVTTLNDVLNAITPTQVAQVGTGTGGVTCQIPRNFEFSVSAEVIVASDAGPQGWVGTISPGALFGAPPPQCAGQAQIPATMNATPDNADFVARVRASEREHVTAIHELHDRHLVPYGQFIMGLSGSGPTLVDCGQSLLTQFLPRATQAAYGFIFGYKAETRRLDDPSGTHIDRAAINTDAQCTSVNLTLSGRPPIPGSSPGNVVPVAPTTVTFNPTTARVNATAVQDGATSIKTFSTAQNAQAALGVIQHYGMTSRNVIDVMEYFLVGGGAPTGALAGANELAINPDYYQVSRGLPTLENDWIIAEVVGNNINTLVNFRANRDAAYSAYDVLRRFRFTHLCWIGATRQSPEMLYFRT